MKNLNRVVDDGCFFFLILTTSLIGLTAYILLRFIGLNALFWIGMILLSIAFLMISLKITASIAENNRRVGIILKEKNDFYSKIDSELMSRQFKLDNTVGNSRTYKNLDNKKIVFFEKVKKIRLPEGMVEVLQINAKGYFRPLTNNKKKEAYDIDWFIELGDKRLTEKLSSERIIPAWQITLHFLMHFIAAAIGAALGCVLSFIILYPIISILEAASFSISFLIAIALIFGFISLPLIPFFSYAASVATFRVSEITGKLAAILSVSSYVFVTMIYCGWLLLTRTSYWDSKTSFLFASVVYVAYIPFASRKMFRLLSRKDIQINWKTFFSLYKISFK